MFCPYVLQSLLAQSTSNTIQCIAISPNSNIPNGPNYKRKREKEIIIYIHVHVTSHTSLSYNVSSSFGCHGQREQSRTNVTLQ